MMVLYHYWRSSASWRVRWALEIKGISCELRAVDLLKSEEKNTEYLKLNPAGYVPCLIAGDFVLGESLAIIEWLEEKFPAVPLLGKSANERAKIRQFAETINSGTQPLINLDVTKKVSVDKAVQEEWTQHWIRRGLSVAERLLREIPQHGQKFSSEDAPNLADVCLVPQCYSALRFKVDLAEFPRCKSIYDYALTTEACKRAHPESYQPSAS